MRFKKSIRIYYYIVYWLMPMEWMKQRVNVAWLEPRRHYRNECLASAASDVHSLCVCVRRFVGHFIYHRTLQSPFTMHRHTRHWAIRIFFNNNNTYITLMRQIGRRCTKKRISFKNERTKRTTSEKKSHKKCFQNLMITWNDILYITSQNTQSSPRTTFPQFFLFLMCI